MKDVKLKTMQKRIRNTKKKIVLEFRLAETNKG